MKKEPPRLRAAVTAAVRTALRRVRAGSNGAAAPPDTTAPRAARTDDPLDIAEERAASRDLLAIDGVVRRFYLLSSGERGDGEWSRLRALFHDRARIGSGKPDPSSSTGLDDVDVDRFIAAARRQQPARYAERSRTVHVLGDLAVVVSAFEVARAGAPEASRGVHVLHLRHAPATGWLIQTVIARAEPRAITEKSADPRPLATRRDH